MQLRSGLLFLAMVWTPILVWAQQTDVLRFSASTSWGMPYAEVRDERLVGGIVFDLTQAIGAALHMPVRYVVLPRKRVEAAVQAGEVDVRCYFNPAWTPSPGQYIFSNPPSFICQKERILLHTCYLFPFLRIRLIILFMSSLLRKGAGCHGKSHKANKHFFECIFHYSYMF